MLPEMANRDDLACFALFCCCCFFSTGLAVERVASSSSPVTAQSRGHVCGFGIARENSCLKLIAVSKQIKLHWCICMLESTSKSKVVQSKLKSSEMLYKMFLPHLF